MFSLAFLARRALSVAAGVDGARGAELNAARRVLACSVNEALALRVQLDLALDVIDGLRDEKAALHARLRDSEAFVSQISRFVEASVPPLEGE